MSSLLAIVMHTAGILGVKAGYTELFALLTPFNLLVMLILVAFTATANTKKFFYFLILACFIGITAEIIGVHTGWLFGEYKYGKALGPGFLDVPFTIGLNWFMVVYASGMTGNQIGHLIQTKWLNNPTAKQEKWIVIFTLLISAAIATLFDWIMEPAAIQLGFWSWKNGIIPFLNYATWFIISLGLLWELRRIRLPHHPFAMYLLLIQTIFFLTIRIL